LIRGNVVYLQNKLKNEIEMFGLGFQEILVIALIVLLLWGGKKIPELMHGLGKGVKSFKDGMNEVTNLEEVKKEEPEKKDE
jgi:sec-independent protein translocase protein TatA